MRIVCCLIGILLLGPLSFLNAAEPNEAAGSTRIAKWQDDRKSAFLLMFDDSAPSHWQMALPAMIERKMIGTFYINPGKAEFTKFKDKWGKDMLDAGMVLGNHTMTHKGVKDVADAEKEIGDCTKIILDMVSGGKPKLVSYAMPGVGPGKWNINDEQLKTILAANNLIDRPPFRGHGAVYHWQTAEQMLALADKGIAAGEMEYLVIHGVERRGINWGYQDFWALNYDLFLAVLDGLKERRDRGDLWITDHISWYRYQAQRAAATVKPQKVTDHSITLDFTCTLDPKLYDQPMTLQTRVPLTWTKVSVTQGAAPIPATASGGAVLFQATPNAGPILLTPAP